MRPNLKLLWAGLAWPLLYYLIGKFTTGASGIPDLAHLYLLSVILPSLAIAIAIIARLRDAKSDWWATGLFSFWVIAWGGFSCMLINAIWASI